MSTNIGRFKLNNVYPGNSIDLVEDLPEKSIDILVTSPPYWGQRTSNGTGTESDPRDYLIFLSEFFKKFLPKLKEEGIVWINMGDAYNTPINWKEDDHVYSSLGADKNGLNPENSAYKKIALNEKLLLIRKARGYSMEIY